MRQIAQMHPLVPLYYVLYSKLANPTVGSLGGREYTMVMFGIGLYSAVVGESKLGETLISVLFASVTFFQ